MQIGFDFGGSLIKLSISYVSYENYDEILESVQNKITHRFSNGTRQYLNILFKREEFEDFIKLLKSIKSHLNQP